ncbi:aldose 1-epimerase [Paenibacillus rhizosphaerae]|uniref:Aldose 1-epimerase n=1 Tax=Paenibacillus rhizosphaerae TaxID=297318 RepID=A0A839TSK2_9BACL|nr:aldose 1-epimerase [Paenibacillus rhizosphaerae]MBB3129765.1 aldose 1-epimerase [Paenibacillus rhizosphaerae]
MKQVTKGQWNGYDTYILHSRELEVTLLPSLGNNVISILDHTLNRQVVRRPDDNDLEFYLQKPYHFGMPMLIPPGRIRGGHFEYEGRSYQFDRNTAGDNHIHGLHRTQSWRVSDIEEDEEGCAVTSEFLTLDDPHWMEQFPAPLKLEMTLRLQGSKLTQHLKVTHLGDHPIPFGIGFHTWFLLDGQPEEWTLTLPVSAEYALDKDLITTGDLLPLGPLDQLNRGLNLAGTNFDTPLRIGEGQPAEALLMRSDGYGLKYSADPKYYKHWVLYTKGEADEFLCIEPYTWLPDAPNLAAGPDLTGLIRIEPKASVEMDLTLDMIYPSEEN